MNGIICKISKKPNSAFKVLLVFFFIVSTSACTSTHVYRPLDGNMPPLKAGKEYLVVFNNGFTKRLTIATLTPDGFRDTEGRHHKFSEIKKIETEQYSGAKTATAVLGGLALFLLIGSLAVKDTIDSGFGSD